MIASELTERLARRPEMCQVWIAARALKDDGGVLYLSSIQEDNERVGVAHIYIWGASAMGCPDAARLMAIDLMKSHDLDRLVCEIDQDNHLAVNLAKRGGMKTIGVIRQRKNRRGVKKDVVLMDALLPDLRRS